MSIGFSGSLVIGGTGSGGGGSVTKTNNFISVGTLTDNNGVISGFDTSNYAVVGNNVSLNDNFEIVIKCKTGDVNTSGNAQVVFGGSTAQYISISTHASENRWDVNIGDGTQWLGVTQAENSVEENKDYWIKATYNNNKYTFYKSIDGTNYTTMAYNNSNTQFIPSMPKVVLGIARNLSSNTWNGTIDLNECYIKSNGIYIWQGRVTE